MTKPCVPSAARNSSSRANTGGSVAASGRLASILPAPQQLSDAGLVARNLGQRRERAFGDLRLLRERHFGLRAELRHGADPAEKFGRARTPFETGSILARE